MTARNPKSQQVLESYLSVYQPGKSGGNLRRIWALGFTLAGRAEDTTADGPLSENRYDFTIFRPEGNASHKWRVPRTGAPWKVLWFMVNPPPVWLTDNALPEILPGIFKLPLKDTAITPKVQQALFAAHDALHSRWPNRYELGMNSLERALLLCQTVITERAQRTDPRVLRAMDYMMQHLFEPIRLPDLMKCAALSQSRFLDLFRQETGITPRTYWERERVRMAQSLLSHTEKPIKEIAGMLGYRYTPYFCRRFRRYTGLTPTAFRVRS